MKYNGRQQNTKYNRKNYKNIQIEIMNITRERKHYDGEINKIKV